MCVTDGATGELRINNHTQRFAGIYLCEVNNAVGAERCRISLRANKRKRKTYTLSNTHTQSCMSPT